MLLYSAVLIDVLMLGVKECLPPSGYKTSHLPQSKFFKNYIWLLFLNLWNSSFYHPPPLKVKSSIEKYHPPSFTKKNKIGREWFLWNITNRLFIYLWNPTYIGGYGLFQPRAGEIIQLSRLTGYRGLRERSIKHNLCSDRSLHQNANWN